MPALTLPRGRGWLRRSALLSMFALFYASLFATVVLGHVPGAASVAILMPVTVVISLGVNALLPHTDIDPYVEVPFTGPVDSDIRGYKTANLYYDPATRRMQFCALTGGLYTADDSAVCRVDSSHDAPAHNCRCGFYAHSTSAAAVAMSGVYTSQLLATVEAYDRIVVHQRGWRAHTQTVLSATIIDRCDRCGDSGVMAIVLPRTAGRPARVCAGCVRLGDNTVGVGDLADLLGTEIVASAATNSTPDQ